ncbi:putative bifunctional diguanylate cyclase/phosphodiesterase [Clostridium ihumii]|uniref:putative bifunctional diguanylate cyclase/phosphodiesterase n=1 Tax=Clostridium ihumii TaxID=1470356 RepID=UPI000684A09B|nr:bifunctional diguanylate cyclase/phosphodiesterase [Clostridium ihumii]
MNFKKDKHYTCFFSKDSQFSLNKDENELYLIKCPDNLNKILFEWNVNRNILNLSLLGYRLLGIEDYIKRINTIQMWNQFVYPEDLKNKCVYENKYRVIRSDGKLLQLIVNRSVKTNDKSEKIIVEKVCKIIELNDNFISNNKIIPTLDGVLHGIGKLNIRSKTLKVTPSINIMLEENRFNKKIYHINDIFDIFPRESIEKYKNSFLNFLNSKERYYFENYKVISSEGKEKYIQVIGEHEKDDKSNVYLAIKEINKSEKMYNEFYKFNYIDEMTGLPNKFALIDIVMKKSREEFINLNRTVSLMSINIIDFREINKHLGYSMGDKILVFISQKIKRNISENEILFKGNADNFFIFSEGIDSYSGLTSKIQNIIELFKEPIQINNKKTFIGINIGVALYPEHGKVLSEIIYKADIAMQKSKIQGRNSYKIFQVNDVAKLNKIFTIEKDLSKALKLNEMYMVFQPKISTINEKTVGLEALLRWNHTEKGLIPPSEFIPIAENTKLIIPIGRFVFEESCKKCREFIDMGYDDFKISINLSKIQLEDKELTGFFIDTLKKYNLNSKYIELEITESVIMNALEKNLEVLENIHNQGISMSLDDFGVGLSPIKYLKILNLDCLKIDKSYIDDIGVNNKSERIIEGLIKLAHSLDLSVIAEGVEKEDQIKYLKSHNCDIVQGYYYAKPMNFEDTIKFLAKEK